MSVIAAACLLEAVVVAASTDVPCVAAVTVVVAASTVSPTADAADATALLPYAVIRGCAIGAVIASVVAAAASTASAAAVPGTATGAGAPSPPPPTVCIARASGGSTGGSRARDRNRAAGEATHPTEEDRQAQAD